MPPPQKDCFHNGTISGLKLPYATSPFDLLQDASSNSSSNLFVAPETSVSPQFWNTPETTTHTSTSTVQPPMSHVVPQQQQPVFENTEFFPYSTVKFPSVADDILQDLQHFHMTTPPLQPQMPPSTEAPMSVNRLHYGPRSDSVESMASLISNSASNSPAMSPMLCSAVATAAAIASPRCKRKNSISKPNKTTSNNPSSPRRRNSNTNAGNGSPRRGGERLPSNEPRYCSNCFTGQTPMWRRSQIDNSLLCNRCGLFFTRHGTHRLIEEKEKRDNMAANAIASPTFVASATPRSLVHSDSSNDNNSPRFQNAWNSDEDLEDFELNDDDGPSDTSFQSNSFPSSTETTPRGNQKLIVNRHQQQAQPFPTNALQPPFTMLPPSLLRVVPTNQPGMATLSLNPNDQQFDLLFKMVNYVAQQNQYQ